jgi:formylmethanofuran dehydrogenase subunit C
MPLTLHYRAQTPIPVEIEGLTPDWAAGKPLAEIERFEVFHGNRKLALAEMFHVTGDSADKHFIFEGNLAGVHWIGAHLRSGQITIHGPAGRHLGSEMHGGTIRVHGDAGGWIGCEMRGGFIHVQGNAGHLVGAAYRGSDKGMRGGTVLVDGDAGNEIGLAMQQGVIAIGGAAGDMLGFNMTGGTILVLGQAGIRPGAGMSGGTIALLGPTPPPVLPSFRYDRTAPPEKLTDLLRKLRDQGLRTDSQLPPLADICIGDGVANGAGELYLRHVR